MFTKFMPIKKSISIQAMSGSSQSTTKVNAELMALLKRMDKLEASVLEQLAKELQTLRTRAHSDEEDA